MTDRALELIDAELARLRFDDISRGSWWEWRLRAWNGGVKVAREVAAEKLQEIRDSYVERAEGT